MITFQTLVPGITSRISLGQHLKQARSQEGEGKTARQTWMAAGAERSNTYNMEILTITLVNTIPQREPALKFGTACFLALFSFCCELAM